MLILIPLLAFSSLQSVSASFNTGPLRECPNLTGNFICPASNGTPEFSLEVRQKPGPTDMAYTLTYPSLGLETTVHASPYGVKNVDTRRRVSATYWAHCVRNTLIYTNDGDTAGFLQENSIYRSAFQARVRGKVVARCTRK